MEEHPRILSILSPAHHLTSALALDNLFGVEPPPMAVNMREALLQKLFFENHLRKIYFLVSSRFDPLSSSILAEIEKMFTMMNIYVKYIIKIFRYYEGISRK